MKDEITFTPGWQPLAIKFKRLGTHSLPLPSKGSKEAAGIDIRAAEDVTWHVVTGEGIFEHPGFPTEKHVSVAEVNFGFAMEIPPGFVALCYIRSGLGMKHNVTLRNSVGVVDSDYRGELRAMLICHAPIPPVLKAGDRICQLVVQRVEDMPIIESDTLSETERGTGGFGSTGVA